MLNKEENKASAPGYIVVIGASAGGIEALKELVSQFDAEMDAAFFIVMHLSETGIGSYLVHRLQQVTSLSCKLAEEGAPIVKGHIYVAQPDKHLLVSKEGIKMGLGPRENRWKPSIDVLFRSAAAAFNGHTIGIILTGYLNDGTAGMLAIKSSGGTTIVQDPNEAEYPDMPLSVLNHMEADHCTTLMNMGEVLKELLQVQKAPVPVPEELAMEAAIAERTATSIGEIVALGNPSIYSCPDCGGVLTEIQDQTLTRYKCHTGHGFSTDVLLNKQKEQLESTLWVALRSLEERKALLRSMEQRNLKSGLHRAAVGDRDRMVELQVHIDRIKQVLFADLK